MRGKNESGETEAILTWSVHEDSWRPDKKKIVLPPISSSSPRALPLLTLGLAFDTFEKSKRSSI